jgi:hypothetical protein
MGPITSELSRRSRALGYRYFLIAGGTVMSRHKTRLAASRQNRCGYCSIVEIKGEHDDGLRELSEDQIQGPAS